MKQVLGKPYIISKINIFPGHCFSVPIIKLKVAFKEQILTYAPKIRQTQQKQSNGTWEIHIIASHQAMNPTGFIFLTKVKYIFPGQAIQ